MNEKKNEKNQFDIIVIGGGAAGLMAAVSAARAGAKTAVIEQKERVGKKILSTGNGKCNYTNKKQGIAYYRGEDPAFVLPAFEKFGFEQTIAFFQQLGIVPKEKNGYYYPQSEQAASILDVLRMELSYQGVFVFTECHTKQILQKKKGFLLQTENKTFLAKKIIFATGLLAAPKTGSDGSAIPFIKAFGHRFSEIVPALTALQCKETFLKELAGVRTEANVTLLADSKTIVSDRGEVQFVQDAVSGIPVFQISRFAAKALKKKQKIQVRIDFLPWLSNGQEMELFLKRFTENARGKTAQEAMIGLFNKKLAAVLLKEANISLQENASRISSERIKQLANLCRTFLVNVTDTRPFEHAQVCAGGVLTREINPHTMESLLVPGVYFAGEVIDIDGMCGGYNLQWAWSSGYAAGSSAAECLGF